MTVNANACRNTDRSQRMRRQPAASAIPTPAVSKSGVVLQHREVRIQLHEFAPDPFDHRPYVGAVAVLALSGDEAVAANDIIDLAIANVVARTFRQQRYHVELVPAERHAATTPGRTLRRLRQQQIADFN